MAGVAFGLMTLILLVKMMSLYLSHDPRSSEA